MAAVLTVQQVTQAALAQMARQAAAVQVHRQAAAALAVKAMQEEADSVQTLAVVVAAVLAE
jgi:hypothetical protein